MNRPTEEQIQAWKKQFGSVFEISAGEGEEKKTAFIHLPNRQQLSYAMMAGQNNPMKTTELMLNDGWIAGDEEIRTDDAYFYGVAGQIASIIDIKVAEIKKL